MKRGYFANADSRAYLSPRGYYGEYVGVLTLLCMGAITCDVSNCNGKREASY